MQESSFIKKLSLTFLKEGQNSLETFSPAFTVPGLALRWTVLSLPSPILTVWTELTLHSSVQFSSVTQLCPTLCDPVDCSTPGLPIHHQLPELLKLMSIQSVMPSNHLILCRPLRLLPSIFPSIRAFSNESLLRIRWPKCWSFSFSISPSNEYSGLISFRMDWLDLLAVQGTLKSLVQHHSSKASILRCSAFFMVQLSHPYTTTGKTYDSGSQFISVESVLQNGCSVQSVMSRILCGRPSCV